MAKRKKEKIPEIYLQSLDGNTISVEDLMKRVHPVETVYVKTEEGKAYWVDGNAKGVVDMWK